MSQEIEVKVISDTVSQDGRRVDFEYTDPVTKIKMIKSLLDHAKRTDDSMVEWIENVVKINVDGSKANASSLVNRKIMVEV